MNREARWASFSDSGQRGLQHVTVATDADGIRLAGIVAGDRDRRAFGLSFNIWVDSFWCVRRGALALTSGERLSLRADGRGMWFDNQERIIPSLEGCIDVDISATPLTNTIPIQRLALTRGERRCVKVAYIAVPDLTVAAAEQAYTCITPGSRYRYESISSGFSAELDLDEHGLVRDYPKLFRRVL